MNAKYKYKQEKYNRLIYNFYYNQLKNIALNAIEWVNLPKEIDYRFLELHLQEMGYILFFYEDIVGEYMVSRCTYGSPLDVYDRPRLRKAYATNGYQRYLTSQNSILIYNNFIHEPMETIIRLYAEELYQCHMTIRINRNGQKTPFIIPVNEQQKLSMSNMYDQYDGNMPAMFVAKHHNPEEMLPVMTPAPYLLDKLDTHYNMIVNRFLSYVGIENANSDKKERLVSTEVDANNGLIENSRNQFINARMQGSKQINEMFGLNVYPRYNSELASSVNMLNMSDDTLETYLEVNGYKKEDESIEG